MTPRDSHTVTGTRPQAGIFALVASYLARHWVRAGLIILLGVGVRLPALRGEFIWDDFYLTRDNPFIKSPLLILESFRHYLFPGSDSGHYRPLQTITYLFDYLAWGNDSYGYHLTNICWHAASGLMLYFLLQRLLQSLAKRGLAEESSAVTSAGCESLSVAAFLLTLLWVVHPVHSAAVDYISGRADSLAFFFAAAGWLLYLRAQTISRTLLRRVCYGLAIFSAFLALCSRETALLWVLLFLVYLAGFEKETGVRAKVLVVATCLVLVASYAGLRHLPHSQQVTDTGRGVTAPLRAVLMLRALGDYGGLMLCPTKLHMERTVFNPVSVRSRQGWRDSINSEYLSLAGLLFAAALLFGACRKGAGRPMRVFGASWFLLTYLPISNLFDLNATVAEHWLYLPSVGFLVFLGGVVIDLPTPYLRYAVSFACLAVAGLGARSAIRSSDWIEPETFFRRTLAAGGTSTRIGVNLAAIYAERGENAKAEGILRKVLEMMPDHPLARNNLASALSHQGKAKEAQAMFEMANNAAPADRAGYPRTWEAARNLARLRHKEKDESAALAILDKARTDYPDTWELISFEAEILRQTHGSDAAVPMVEEFARDHWWHFGASLALGRLYTEKGDVARAEAAFRHASWLDIHDAEALNLIALIELRYDHLDLACQLQRRAIARRPDEPRQYLFLSQILEKMNRPTDAREALAQISRLQEIAHAPVAALN